MRWVAPKRTRSMPPRRTNALAFVRAQLVGDQIVTKAQHKPAGFQRTAGYGSKKSGSALLLAIRGETEWPCRVSVSLTLAFDFHRLHQEALVATLPVTPPQRGRVRRARGPSPFADQARTEVSS